MKENKTRISTKKHLKDVKINIIDKNDNQEETPKQ
jgi:hypothetical protein